MNNAHLLFLPLVLAAACAPVSPISQAAVEVAPPVPVAPFDSVSMEVRSWGRLLHSWTIDGTGLVEHRQVDKPFADDARLQIRRTTLDRDRQAALRASLDRIETIRQQPGECASQVTDQPYGKVAWTAGAISVSYNFRADCVEGRDARLASAIREADSLVDDILKTKQPIESREPGPSDLGR